MEVIISVAKVEKYATSESGDTLEVVERAGGGISVVLADGQSSGRGAKRISNMVVRKTISLLAEGVRDGAAARAAADYLFHERHGKVSATLNILSLDFQSRSLVITRNNPAPVLLAVDGTLQVLDDPCQPVGVYRRTRPVIHEADLRAGITVLLFTDGLVHAGDRTGQKMDYTRLFTQWVQAGRAAPQIADELMATALELDQGRPVDDISVVVLQVTATEGDAVRRMTVRLPVGPL